MDLGFLGPKFTWNNGREGDDFIQERLDRVVTNEGWCDLFPKLDILVEGAMCSYHLPIVVTMHDEMKRGGGGKNFKHEAYWVLDETYHEVIKKAWQSKIARADQWGCLQVKLGNCQVELKKWQEKKKGHEAEIKKLCQQVAALQATV
jgi:hypothetical protein